MSSSFFFDSLWILESLAEKERFAADIVHGLHAAAADLRAHAAIHHRAVDSKAAFSNVMAAIAADCVEHHHSPILQLNLHGSQSGLGFSSGEFVTWEEVAPTFAQINAASHLNLMVLMAACDGASLFKAIDPSKPAPIWAVVGPIRPITIGEALQAFPAFYREVFASLDGAEGWRRMNAAIDAGDKPFAFYSCSAVFQRVFKGYHAEACTPESLHARARKIKAEYRRMGLTGTQIAEVWPKVLTDLHDLRSTFEHFRDQFFMVDRYPAHRERFPTTFEDCAA
jgi:hypothetical protein